MNLEKHASLVYKQMAAHFSNNNVAKKGFAGLFSSQAHEEHEHFEKFMNYIILRGNSVPTFKIEMPPKSQWESVQNALEDALELENKVYNEIIRVHKIADKTCKDVHVSLSEQIISHSFLILSSTFLIKFYVFSSQLMNFLESEFVEEQVASIAKITKLSTMVRGAGTGYGEYLIDRDISQGKLKLDEL